MSLFLFPVTIREANELVKRWHRTHESIKIARFAIAVGIVETGRVCGTAIVANPVARSIQDGFTAEVRRVATDGTRNACSMLYGACWRASKAMGFRRLITYTLPEEGGASLRGAGWYCVGEAGGGSWNRPSRPRIDLAPMQVKLRWEAQPPAVLEE